MRDLAPVSYRESGFENFYKVKGQIRRSRDRRKNQFLPSMIINNVRRTVLRILMSILGLARTEPIEDLRYNGMV